MPAPDDLARITLTAAAGMLDAGTVTSTALTEAVLQRAAHTEHAHHAYAHLDPEQALRSAAEADTRRADGRPRSAIDGIPIGVKDLLLTADMPTRGGTHPESGYRGPLVDEAVVAQLRATGAVLVGKHTTHHFASGRCPSPARNAVDPVMFSGGSSSGSGASVALGSSFASLGTDSGGSVRAPAALNGIVGYLPTLGTLAEGDDGMLGATSYSGPGVLARTVRDSALVAASMTGRAELLPGRRPDGLAGVRVGLLSALQDGAKPETGAVVGAAVDRVIQAGAEPLRGELPVLDHVTEIFDVLAGYEVHRAHRRMLAEHPEAYCEAIRPGYLRGADIAAEDHRAAVARRDVVRAGILDWMDAHGVDVLIGPTVGQPAVPAEGMDAVRELRYYAMFTMFANLAAMPAITLPAGTVPGGLPVGLQVVGRHGDDARVLAVAARIEDALARG